jgi:hypothetical protein
MNLFEKLKKKELSHKVGLLIGLVKLNLPYRFNLHYVENERHEGRQM